MHGARMVKVAKAVLDRCQHRLQSSREIIVLNTDREASKPQCEQFNEILLKTCQTRTKLGSPRVKRIPNIIHIVPSTIYLRLFIYQFILATCGGHSVTGPKF